MPPKGFNGKIPGPIRKIIAYYGTRVYIDHPVAITYDIKSNDDILSVGIAINKARHDIRYSHLDWNKVYYTTGKFIYQELFEENS